jgi:hypothetical protein
VKLSRAQFVSRAAAGGAVALAGATGLGVLAAPARAALPDNDLAYLRLLVGCELLGADFYAKAQQAKPYDAPGMELLARAGFNEGEHYTALADTLTAAGQTPETADDVDFTYPKATFTSVAGVTKAAVDLETIFLGSYLGALGGIQSTVLAGSLARVAASQAQHLAVFTRLLGRRSFELSFPTALTIDAASDALAPYTA